MMLRTLLLTTSLFTVAGGLAEPGVPAACWIGVPGRYFSRNASKAQPAPVFRTAFPLQAAPSSAKLRVSAGGYYRVEINGRDATCDELAPTPSNFDRRVYARTYDVAGLLRTGTNEIRVTLGSGFYSYPLDDVFLQNTITWRDYPSLWLEMRDGQGAVLAASGPDWQVATDGPLRFECIRAGNVYDARKELGPQTAWTPAAKTHGPGGVLVEARHPRTVVHARLPMKRLEGGIWDSGQNLAGVAELRVRGEAGAEVTLVHREDLDGRGGLLTPGNFAAGEFQTDHYVLKGGGEEVWRPRFAYHGFRYVRAEVKGTAEVLGLTALAIGSDLAEVGRIETSDAGLAALQRCIRWSVRSNLVGYPTDCPSREKQGWSGDAHLALETALFNYDAQDVFLDWMRTWTDIQRPNGQLPCKSPVSANGYNWGFGPAWDAALFEIPWSVYLRTGDRGVLAEFYPAMTNYVPFACSMMTGGAATGFGLGDWCSPDQSEGAGPNAVCCSTAYHCRNLALAARIASVLDHPDDARRFGALRDEAVRGFRRHFCRTDGAVGRDRIAELALALAFGLARDRALTERRFLDKAEKLDGRCDFGILGARWLPEVLSDLGRSDLAYRFFTRRTAPGYGDWIARGATTLWEQWDGSHSRNHEMYAHPGAWMFGRLGGFSFHADAPGRIFLRPVFLRQVGSFSATYRGVASSWTVGDAAVDYVVTVPEGRSVELLLPGEKGGPRTLGPGRHAFRIRD